MSTVRGQARIRSIGWRMVILTILLISLVSCSSGKKKQAKQRNTQLAASRYQLGWRYFQDGEVRRSLGEFLESVRLEPRNAYYQNSLGQAYLFQQQRHIITEMIFHPRQPPAAFRWQQANP